MEYLVTARDIILTPTWTIVDVEISNEEDISGDVLPPDKLYVDSAKISEWVVFELRNRSINSVYGKGYFYRAKLPNKHNRSVVHRDEVIVNLRKLIKLRSLLSDNPRYNTLRGRV